ncbi:hypothetical protein D3C72_2179310 [compost metagenome]
MILGITTATVAAGKVALSVGKLAFSGSNANNLVPTGIVQNAASNMDKAAGATSGGFKEGGFLYRHWMSRIPESQRFHVNTPY